MNEKYSQNSVYDSGNKKKRKIAKILLVVASVELIILGCIILFNVIRDKDEEIISTKNKTEKVTEESTEGIIDALSPKTEDELEEKSETIEEVTEETSEENNDDIEKAPFIVGNPNYIIDSVTVNEGNGEDTNLITDLSFFDYPEVLNIYDYEIGCTRYFQDYLKEYENYTLLSKTDTEVTIRYSVDEEYYSTNVLDVILYDEEGKIISYEHGARDDSHFINKYEYDENDNIISIIGSWDSSYYTYDENNRPILRKIDVFDPFEIIYEYHEYTYDDTNHLVGIVVTRDEKILQDIKISYDENDCATEVWMKEVSYDGVEHERTYTYTYKPLE